MAKRILIAEDTPDLLDGMRESLTMEGYDVIASDNGETALKQLSEPLPNLIVTDLRMPVMDGFELIRRVRENPHWDGIPILVFSSMPIHEYETRAREIGANQFLIKPCSMEKFLHTVAKSLL